MSISRKLPTRVPYDDFAAWARLAVRYVDHPSAMPLVRLDRHGLTVAFDENAESPEVGLPRRAVVVGDSMPLCELRLVAREATREEGRATTVTLEPSRDDDHALLWKALVAYRTHLGAAPSGAGSAKLPSLDLCSGEWHTRASCDAAFTLGNHDDAWFFSRWLDYHFAELRARARMSDAAADLRDLFIRVVDHEVEVRFIFRAAERIVRASTETMCRWIAAEAAQQVGLTVEHWLPGAPTACASPAGWPVRAVMASRGGNHSFSSK